MSVTGIGRDRMCAVFVTRNPDAGFPGRLRATLPQVGRVLVVDNGSGGTSLETLRSACDAPGTELLENGANLGVASALNRGVRRARELGCGFAVLLDQDSVPEPFLVAALSEALSRCPFRDRVAVVGSNYKDDRRDQTLVSPGGPGDDPWIPRPTVITSGSLVSLDAHDSIGPFREDFFVDHVDDEYCLRARAAGYDVILCRRPAIRHSIGSATRLPIPFFHLWTSNHSRERRYYMARNFTVLAREVLRREPAWVARTFLRHLAFAALMLLFEDDRRGKLRGLSAGVRDGLAGRMGRIRS